MLTDLRMFADGTGLSKQQMAELRDAGMIYPDGVQWLLTEQGRKILTDAMPTWLDSPPLDKITMVGQTALDVQVGGSHYKGFKIQPIEFIEANNLPFLDGCVIKRVCRHGSKAGVEDLLKAKHEIDLIIQLRYKGAV